MWSPRSGVLTAALLWWTDPVHAGAQGPANPISSSVAVSTATAIAETPFTSTVTLSCQPETIIQTISATTVTLSVPTTGTQGSQTPSVSFPGQTTTVTVNFTQTLPAQTVTHSLNFTETLPAQTVTQTFNFTQTLPMQTVTQTLNFTETLPAQTVTQISNLTKTVTAFTQTQTSTVTETDYLDTEYLTFQTTTSLTVEQRVTVTRVLPTNTTASPSPSVVAPYGLIQYSAPDNQARGCGYNYLGPEWIELDGPDIGVREYEQDLSANRYQLDSHGVVRTVQYCSPACTNKLRNDRWNDTGYTWHDNPGIGLRVDAFAGNVSFIAMLADGDPAAGSYPPAKCTIDANSIFQCYWDDTGVPGDWWKCAGFIALAQSGTDLSGVTTASTTGNNCYRRGPLIWRPFNESTAVYQLGKCSP